MSAATTTPQRAVTPAGTRGPAFGRVLAAEWTKVVSLRSPWWTAAATVLVGGAITYLSAQASSVDPGFQPVDSLTTGLVLAQIGPLVLGVLVGAGEFRTGAVRTTFTTVPRRWPVLAAQALVVGAFALGVGVLTALASALGILPPAASRGITVDLAAGDGPGLLLGTALLVVGLALLGHALGALLRRTVPALVTALVVVLVLPVVLMTASDPLLAGGDPASLTAAGTVPRVTLVGTLNILTPGTAGSLMTTSPSAGAMEGTPDLGPVGGGLVLAAWVLVLLVAAAVRLRTRDVR
ncbi:ABC transporter permease subunit [Cellulomonas fimi]|uniref:Integral membrane protein n=1 Tax=Cellulomonas fimi (strain ATCC 484 / DSM 20113 / JCM 1341 / CCUG 24087 / LMG 16345 / NBRC 15513 / NCIMB 8980 / NCTC 7547 / NRS-133) TaxID=590998 RepID=F4H7L0_CELFA|nr:ABC transporter permease subunit [Cellulomonas fimi]AEE44567.1 integral membrane protein [Cellulomonas fimi ATCC 484]NNH06457.1 ABC transporter permease [Cellulomonas fimi]VEH26644.1 ABC-2 family transporter protein [Cellulomonas fimi]